MRLNAKQYVAEHLVKLDAYISGVTNNVLIVNRFEKLAVERFLKHKQKYIYKESELVRVLKFFALLNIPHENTVQQFQLLGYQVFWLANIFGLYRDETTRLFSQSFLLTAKKSGKSTISAALAIYSCIANNILNSHALLVASSREQARILLQYVDFIIKNSPALSNLFVTNKNIIYNRTDKSINKIEVRASEAGKINGTGAGVALSVVDEFAFHPNADLQQSIKSGQIVQTNHHQIIISTASNDLNSPGFAFFESAKNILEEIVENDDLFTVIYTLDHKDEYKDKINWPKANPALGHTFSYEALEIEVNSIKAFPQKLETVLTHHFNVWINVQTESFINDDIVKSLMRDNVQIPSNEQVFCGADFSSLNDLSSLCALYYDKDKDIFIAKLTHIFPSNEKNRIKAGSIDLYRWIEDGFITRCQTKSLDEDLVVQKLEEMSKQFQIVRFGFDPFNARILMSRVQNELGLFTYEVRQNYTLSYPLKVIEKYMENGRLFLDRSPVTRWQFKNLRVKTDRNGNYLIYKNKEESVDGIVALTVAMHQFLEYSYDMTGVSHNLEKFNW